MNQRIPGTSVSANDSVFARANLNTMKIGFNKYSTNGDMMVDRLESNTYGVSFKAKQTTTGNKIKFEISGEVVIKIFLYHSVLK